MELDSSDGLNIVNILKLSNLYILKCLKWSILCYVNCILKKKKAVSTRNLTVASDRISFLKWIYWLIKRGFFFLSSTIQFQAWMDQGAQVISSDWRAPPLGSGFFCIGFIFKQAE